jgi:hypothetical protein
VLCRIGNGKADVPVRNAEVKLMEGDRGFFNNLAYSYFLHFCLTLSVCWFSVLDCDDLLALGITDAEGAFSLDGHELEGNDEIEPYLLIKACRKADDESSCNVKKIIEPERGLIVKNYNYFMDDEFCQHCQGGGECKSA